ncbi:hypothetical protein NE865_14036 [Phthorimaea operculella]|nr:hypothetical protein NE865_14036 [Phthorimaea operculella]
MIGKCCFVMVLSFFVYTNAEEPPGPPGLDANRRADSDATTENANNSTEPEEDDVTFPEQITLSDKEMEDLANIDFGTWSPMDYAFRYYNRQNYWPIRPAEWATDQCYKQYFRCTLADVHPYPVCGASFEWYPIERQYFVDIVAGFPNKCDLFLHNCRTKKQMYETTYEGMCRWNRYYLFHNARRMIGGKVKKVFQKLFFGNKGHTPFIE